jgi:hypothetical protein
MAGQGTVRWPRTGTASTSSEKRPRGGQHLLPRVNRVVALLTRWLLGIHQGRVSAAHLDGYLDEFAFRFNRRTSRWRGKLFYPRAQQTVAVEAMFAKRSRRQVVSV